MSGGRGELFSVKVENISMSSTQVGILRFFKTAQKCCTGKACALFLR